MWTRLQVAVYTRTPARMRRVLIRTAAPTYAVGALLIVHRPDGRILLVRQSYRPDWFLPGGLLKRREGPARAAARELREEVGIAAAAVSDPIATFIDPTIRTVTAFCEATVDEHAAAAADPASHEILQVAWFPPQQLPPLNEELVRALRGIRLLGF